jgi:arsenite transporter
MPGSAILTLLARITRHGRLVLVAGLLLGIVLPELARAMRPLIVPLIMLMLFLATLRIGPRAMRMDAGELGSSIARTCLLQSLFPLTAVAVLWLLGALHTVVGLGVVLALSASPITGSPGLAILSGADPAPALRQLVVGTTLLPVTVLPVFWLAPVFPDPAAVIDAALRLVIIIVVAGGGALWLRRLFPRLARPTAVVALDATMTLVMGLLVIALMSAVGPALLSGDATLWAILALVLALNFGSQLTVARWWSRHHPAREAPAMGIVAGNRNLALFLGALPPGTVDELLLFVGCYQVPMYLTPLLMARYYRRRYG